MSDDRSKNAIDAKYEDLGKTLACVKQMTQDFDTMSARRREQTAEFVRLTEELQRMGGASSRGASRFQSPAGRGDSAIDTALQQIEQSLIRKKARREELCQAASAFAQALVARTENLEKRRRRQEAVISSAPSLPIVTGGNQLMPDEFSHPAPQGNVPVSPAPSHLSKAAAAILEAAETPAIWPRAIACRIASVISA